MPEVGTDILPSAAKILEKTKIYFPERELREIIEGQKEEYIGRGAECIVIGKRSNPELVVAFNYKGIDPIKAKQLFYVHRIASTLFPKNFPQFYASFGGDYSGTIRKRVHQMNSSNDVEAKYPFSKVIQESKQWGLPIDFDQFDKNFIVASDGGEYYVDRLLISGSNHFDRFLDFMVGNGGYSARDMRVVELSIKRYAALEKARRKKIKE